MTLTQRSCSFCKLCKMFCIRADKSTLFFFGVNKIDCGTPFSKTVYPFQELAAAGEQFDMVFIDADKNNYINYYNFILDNNLLRLQGIICVDNSLFKAKVYLKDTTDNNGLALREFNQFVSTDPRVEQVLFLQIFTCCCICWPVIPFLC